MLEAVLVARGTARSISSAMHQLPLMLNYFGSKHRLAGRYPVPKYKRIVEVFAGGAGYSLRHSDHDVILCDVNPDVIDVWKYLIGATEAEILALPLLEPGQHVDTLGLDRGPSLLLKWTVNQAVASPRNYISSWKAGLSEATFWNSARRARTAEAAKRIKHWTAVLVSWEDIDPTDAPSTWFVDPPYSSRAGRNYPHHSVDYLKLGSFCRSLPGQVIACDISTATWIPFAPLGGYCRSAIKGVSDEGVCVLENP